MSRLERFKHAKIIGPGVWYNGHKFCEDAAASKDPKDFDFAYEYIRRIRTTFICGKCRAHLNDFALSNNPERFVDTKDSQGLADWWYDAHNNANEITKNPKETREDVRKFFTSAAGLCNLDCDTADDETPSPIFNKIESPSLSNVRKGAPGVQAPELYSPIKSDFKSAFAAVSSYIIKK